MKLDVLIDRPPMVPFAPGSGLPWNEADFSQRMLTEHLSQHHDRGSRRFEIIDQQVDWIHQVLLDGKPGRILDLGCGPGLHTTRLARLGHGCTGLDFSPAAIEYAKSEAEKNQDGCEYHLADLGDADLGSGFDAVLMLFGEFNTLAPAHAASLLTRVHSALAPSGRLLLELHFDDYVQALGEEPPEWTAEPSGPFSSGPYLALHESQWHEEETVTTERYWVFEEGQDDGPRAYSLHTQAYTDEELDGLLEAAGLEAVGRYESLTGDVESEAELFGLVGARMDAGL
ncbi:MAG: class I SAM-dependent methyltransferase [Myxococcota bacterium]|nr:SAM-dependent methyltransferase [Spirochaeta sp.]RPG11797.1 MAG: class I SAM-dependent methyltransferase [Proteobacteria bacterium TMED72]